MDGEHIAAHTHFQSMKFSAAKGAMTDVVLNVPVKVGEEARMFGRFLDRFVEGCVQEAAASVAPYVMIRSDPEHEGQELKVLTFQESSAASAFSLGWARIRGAASALVRS